MTKLDPVAGSGQGKQAKYREPSQRSSPATNTNRSTNSERSYSPQSMLKKKTKNLFNLETSFMTRRVPVDGSGQVEQARSRKPHRLSLPDTETSPSTNSERSYSPQSMLRNTKDPIYLKSLLHLETSFMIRQNPVDGSKRTQRPQWHMQSQISSTNINNDPLMNLERPYSPQSMLKNTKKPMYLKNLSNLEMSSMIKQRPVGGSLKERRPGSRQPPQCSSDTTNKSPLTNSERSYSPQSMLKNTKDRVGQSYLKKLIALRDKFYHQAKACGWIEPGTKRSISDTVRKFFASYKHKPINELREILFSSKYVKTNPAKYQNLDYLQEYINPYLTQIKEVMVNYCNFMRGTREHPESVETLSKNLAKELLEFIPDANAVHALVTNYFQLHTPSKLNQI